MIASGNFNIDFGTKTNNLRVDSPSGSNLKEESLGKIEQAQK